MSVTCVPIYGLMFRILTRFHTLYFGASCIHSNSIVWRRVISVRFPYWPEKRTRRISRYSYLLETLISSEYGLTISGHVTVLRQWPLENTDYIINKIIVCLWLIVTNSNRNNYAHNTYKSNLNNLTIFRRLRIRLTFLKNMGLTYICSWNQWKRAFISI